MRRSIGPTPSRCQRICSRSSSRMARRCRCWRSGGPPCAHLAGFPGQAMMLALVLGLAGVGGSDTDRFLMWGAPIVLVLIGKAAESVNWASVTGAAVLLLIAQLLS